MWSGYVLVAQGRAGAEGNPGRANSADDLLPCADDLLSLMVLLLTRASVHYLSANATFMDHFLSLQTPFQHKGELGCVGETWERGRARVRGRDLGETTRTIPRASYHRRTEHFVG
jgi:hypothetical protein